jgi:hypothetical protein
MSIRNVYFTSDYTGNLLRSLKQESLIERALVVSYAYVKLYAVTILQVATMYTPMLSDGCRSSYRVS